MENLVDDHESICDRCGGVGSTVKAGYRSHKRMVCPKCGGTGRLDWIERIVGKSENN